MRIRYLFVLVILLLSTGIFAQQTDVWYLDKPIVEIKFEGLQHVSQSELDPIVEPFIGRKFSDSLFMDLQSKLYALNYFSLIEAEAVPRTSQREDLILLFKVDERPIVDQIEINGNRNVRDSEILDTILLKRDDILTRNKLNVDEGAIRDLYQEKGFSNIEISSETITNEEENTVRVVFNVVEGFQTRVQSISFSGNSFAPESALKKQLVSKEQTFFSSGIFKQNQLEEDKARIEQYYHEQGFIDAKVVDVTREVVESEGNRNFLAITFFIEEGRQWTFGGIDFDGNQLFSDEELQSKVSLEEGEILNLNKLQQSFTRISDLYYNDGYIYNSISQRESRNEEERSISFEIMIVEKGRAHIENIIIKGNEKTKDKVIFREIPLEVGEIFSKEKVINGMQNLYNTGLFSNVV
ncbi:MAG: BamA/OMP85 family outer membrane protein, partial [Sediminispirochaetaceae bacterium]